MLITQKKIDIEQGDDILIHCPVCKTREIVGEPYREYFENRILYCITLSKFNRAHVKCGQCKSKLMTALKYDALTQLPADELVGNIYPLTGGFTSALTAIFVFLIGLLAIGAVPGVFINIPFLLFAFMFNWKRGGWRMFIIWLAFLMTIAGAVRLLLA
ncbi:hypothetical protein JD969_07550 [Planctomycetota bacterium]|nr:hypothetical protein JD969_07550 [Planctomycetota bacterium]